MTASIANGFAQTNFRPNDATCTQTPYAFHPMYSTSSEDTRIPWSAAHSYNVAYADEIGHFEYCGDVNEMDGTCNGDASDPGSPDGDDAPCRTADQSLFVRIGGCFGTDNDFDGTSYQNTWAGTISNPGKDRHLHSTSLLFSSPTFDHGQNYQRMGFEADLPRIEAADFGGADRSTGAGCTNPPPGAEFYPIFSTTRGAGSGAKNCLVAGGRNAHPGDEEHVRRKLHGAVRPAAEADLSGTGVPADLPLQRLQADLEQQPLSRLSKEND